jgi:trk system potassium uptake protein TrkH
MTTEYSGSRFKPICYYAGLIVLALGALQVIPIAVSLAYREWHIVLVFLTTLSIALIVASAMLLLGAHERHATLSFGEGMVVAASSWFLSMLLAALPYYWAGDYLSYLDACFDVMSGFTTTGLTLIQDMDHISNGINMWRFVLTYVGGQGMVVLVLTFLIKGQSGAYRMYVGEAKDERLFPNAVSTARRIWRISLMYLAAGTVVFFFAALSAGLPADRAVLHGLWVNMSAWSTGGFAPMSQSILYYHSTFFELTTVAFFVAGSFNFALHHAVLSGNYRELRKNIETITFSITLTLTVLIALTGLMKLNVYPNAVALFRKGFYQMISGHTTTGFMTIYAKQFYYEWGNIALFAIMVAMMLGGSACSTGGGFKGLRTGLIFSAFRGEIKRMMLPESRVHEQRIHHIKNIVLTDSVVKNAALIVIAYIATFTIGTLLTMLAGYPAGMAAFEAASVTGNVGLSIGVTSASMPGFLKIAYIVMMWLARLEFMSVFALVAYVIKRGVSVCKRNARCF